MVDEAEVKQRNGATLAVLCDALRTRDLAALGSVMADEVRWHGCRTRDDVLATVRERFAAGPPPQVDRASLEGDRAVLRIGLPGAQNERWFVLALDAQGLICALRDYSSEQAAEHDLALLARGPQPPPWPAVDRLVPFVHVADMARSVAFYALLGFAPVSTFEPGGELVWAFLHSGDARIMLARADGPVDAHEQAVLFYLYAGDLAALRDHLVGHGVAAGEIFDGTPAPKQQMRLGDPDGYVLMIAQIEPDA